MQKRKIKPTPWLYPEPAVLVGTIVDNKPNFITIGYTGIVAASPPMIAIGIRPHRYSLKGIREHGWFSVNIPPVSLMEKTDYIGVYSGNEIDKSKIFSVYYGENSKAPFIEECALSHACQVVTTVELGSHVLVVGEIKETLINEDCITQDIPIPEKIDPLIYSGGVRTYHRLGDVVGKAFEKHEK